LVVEERCADEVEYVHARVIPRIVVVVVIVVVVEGEWGDVGA
jgi:hypothetical protein